MPRSTTGSSPVISRIIASRVAASRRRVAGVTSANVSSMRRVQHAEALAHHGHVVCEGAADVDVVLEELAVDPPPRLERAVVLTLGMGVLGSHLVERHDLDGLGD